MPDTSTMEFIIYRWKPTLGEMWGCEAPAPCEAAYQIEGKILYEDTEYPCWFWVVEIEKPEEVWVIEREVDSCILYKTAPPWIRPSLPCLEVYP